MGGFNIIFEQLTALNETIFMALWSDQAKEGLSQSWDPASTPTMIKTSPRGQRVEERRERSFFEDGTVLSRRVETGTTLHRKRLHQGAAAKVADSSKGKVKLSVSKGSGR